MAVGSLSYLPFASRVAWASSLTAAIIGLLLIIWASLAIAGKVTIEISPRHFRWHFAVLASLVSWILIQSLLPVPPNWAHPSWIDAREILALEFDGRISATPGSGLTLLVLLLSYVGVFWLTLQLTRRPARAFVCMMVISGTGGVIALVGLISHLGGWTLLPWMPEQAPVVRGTFINRNHFATLCGLTLVVSVGLFLDLYARERHRSIKPLRASGYLVRSILGGGWFHLTVILMASMALIMSGSRAGVAASGVGLLTLICAIYLPVGQSATRIPTPVWWIAIIVIVTFVINGDHLLFRFQDQPISESARFLAFGDAFLGILDYPLTGVGYGAFEQAFQVYRGEDLEKLYYYLENTYLEMIFELGIPAGLLWFAMLGAICYRCLRGVLVRARNRVYPAIALSSAALAGFHAMFDYSFQVPAIALSFAMILGVGVAQSWPTEPRPDVMQGRSRRTLGPKPSGSPSALDIDD